MGKKGGRGGMIGNQVFAFTNANQIMSDNNCLDVSDKKGNFTIFYFKDMYFQVPCLGSIFIRFGSCLLTFLQIIQDYTVRKIFSMF